MLGTVATPQRRWAKLGLVGALVGLLAIGVSACGTGMPSPATSSASVSISPTTSDPDTDAAAKALAAYRSFIDAYIAAGATADYKSTELRKYLGDPLLGDVIYDLSQMNQHGLVRTGQPTSAPHVSEVKITGVPKTVTIVDCMDSTNWNTVYKATGKSAELTGQSSRHKVVAEAYLYDDGRWLIHKSTVDRNGTC